MIIGAVVMIIAGNFLTQNVYKDYGAYTIYYYGRYYGGLACMIVGGGLFFIGLLLPILWPRSKILRKTPQQATSNYKLKQNTSVSSKASVNNSKTSSDPISLKVRRLSMQTTYGKDAINFLKVLLELEPTHGMNSMTVSNNLSINLEQTKKTANLLLNLNLIQKNKRIIGDEYLIPRHLRKKIFSAIYED